jgi:hypothetical protein
MARECRFTTFSLTVSLIGLLLVTVMLSGVDAGPGIRRGAVAPSESDFCSQLKDRVVTLDIDPTTLPANTCDHVKTVNNFTLRFTGVDNDYIREESMWYYTLEWNGSPPELHRLAIGVGDCITRMNIIGACPAGYSVGVDPETGMYAIFWSSLPTIAALHISFLVDGIYEVGQMPFAVNSAPETICGLICDQTCDLSITCPPDITLDCFDPTDPSSTGYPVVEGNCPPHWVSFTDTEIGGDCPYDYTIERTWTVSDASGLVRECVQMISVHDIIPPVITCPPDVDYECDDMGSFGEATAEDNCDPDPTITRVDSVVFYRCPWEYIKERTWTATDACGNSSSCIQTITIHDSQAPVITYCPQDITVACEDEIDFSDMATAEDNCNPEPAMSYEAGRQAGQSPCEYVIIREWQFTDHCCNLTACRQKITVKDTVPPVLTCAEDDTIGCEDDVVFTDPAVTDNCDPDPEITIVFTKVIPHCEDGVVLCECTEDWEAIHIRRWKAVDACGNKAECEQKIYVELCGEGPMCTYTQGGWGSGCPDSQRDNMMSTQPGCIRDHYFETVFPNGVMIGDTTGAASGAVWTTAAAVEAFLPAGGPCTHLPADLIDPTETHAGNIMGQLLSLRMSREYSCAGVWETLGLAPETICLGDFVIPSACGKFAGLTVDEFLALADQAVSGDSTVLIPYGADYTDVKSTADCMNNRYDECWSPIEPGAGDVALEVVVAPVPDADSDPGVIDRDVMLPSEVTVSSHPNPLTGSTTISYSLPVGGSVTIEVYDINGRIVAGLVNADKAAGFHGVVWDGRDTTGGAAASGVYFCRVKLGNESAVMEKLIKL